MISPTRDETHATEPPDCDDDRPYCSCGASLAGHVHTGDCPLREALEDDAEIARLQLKRLGHEPNREDDL